MRALMKSMKRSVSVGRADPAAQTAYTASDVMRHRVSVRGRATGAPTGELFGVPPTGRRFEIMSLDVHTIEGGKVVRTHHVEDWAGAIRQLRG